MTNIDRPGGGVGRGAEHSNHNSFANNLGDRRGLETNLFDKDPLEFDEESPETSSTSGRQAEFLKSFKAAIRGFKEKNSEQQKGEEREPELRMLAVAEQRLWTGLPSPAGNTEAAPEGLSSTEAAVNSINEAIDRSIRAEMAHKPGAPIAINIAFRDESLGVMGLRIIVNHSNLDVIFERTRGEAPVELIRAAQMLAERLMTRFSKKTVRILDTVVSDRSEDQEQAEETAIAAAPFKPFL